jgi:2-dehydro-3-deoxyglucarate aldolase
MKSRGNKLKQALQGEQPAVGGAVLTGSPLFVETLGDIGFDFVWVDLEHLGPSPYDASYLEHLTRAADTGGTELIVRIPRPEPAIIRKVLDAGVRNVLVPRIESAEEVERAVRAANYVYKGETGERGLALSRANGWGIEMEEYTVTEDESVLIGAMIENETAIERLDEILRVPELGFAFIGPADLSASVGHPLDISNTDVQNRITQVIQRCADADIPVAGIAPERSAVPEMIEDGYDILVVDSDIEAVQERASDRLEMVKDSMD